MDAPYRALGKTTKRQQGLENPAGHFRNDTPSFSYPLEEGLYRM